MESAVKEFVNSLRSFTEQENCNNVEQVLILIDGDGIGKLLTESSDTRQNAVDSIKNSIESVLNCNNNSKNSFYHFGSDNFGVIINESYPNESINLLNEIIKENNKNKINVTISAGLAKYLSKYEKNICKWYTIAHINLLRSKESGGNCYFADEV